MADKSVGKILDKKASSAIRKGGGSISEKEMIKIMLDSGKESGLFKKMEMGGSVQKKNKKLKMYENAPHTYKKLDDEVLRNLEIGDGRAKPSDKDIDYGDMMIKAGKVKKMKYGGKAVPVAKVKIERLKKMRDPYGESNFAHQISDGKDAYTQRVIAAMKESGQPFMDGGKVEKMNYGGKVKKMNMGGVVPGRGGSFKGVR